MRLHNTAQFLKLMMLFTVLLSFSSNEVLAKKGSLGSSSSKPSTVEHTLHTDESVFRWEFKVPVEIKNALTPSSGRMFRIQIRILDKDNKQKSVGTAYGVEVPVDADGNFSGIVDATVYTEKLVPPGEGYTYTARLFVGYEGGSGANIFYAEDSDEQTHASKAVPGTELITEVSGAL